MVPLLHTEWGIYRIYKLLKYFNSLLVRGFVILGVKVVVIDLVVLAK